MIEGLACISDFKSAVNEQLPSVGIVIPCFNAAATLRRTVESVLGQDDVNPDIVIVDDGSTDASLTVACSFKPMACVLTGPNRGAAAARNAGLERTRSEYVLFLDADDYIEPGSLKAWVSRATEADADIVLGPFAYERNGKRQRGQPPHTPTSPQNVLRQWLEGWFTPPCSVLWRRSFVISIGGWNPEARLRNDDGELMMRALLSDPRLAVTDEGLGVYVQHNSASRISRRRGYAVMSCELSLLRSLWEMAQLRGYSNLRSNFARSFYQIAYGSFATGVISVGRDALHEARQLGLRGHIGSAAHCIFSTILGLRIKLLLSGILKKRIALKIENRRFVVEYLTNNH